MRFHLLFFFVFLLCFENTGFTQGTIRGTLRDRSSNQPIGIGKLTLVNKERRRAPKREISPNDNGTFIFTGVEEGLYDLLYEAEGFITQRVLGLYIKDKGEKLAYLKIRPNTTNLPAPEELITTYASLQSAKQKEVKTASFDADKLIDAPATVFLLTQQDIREQGLTSISDIFNLIPSMEVQEASNYYSYNLFSVRGVQGGKKIIILLNGVRISSFTANSSTLDKNIFIGNAEQVEILLGSASVMYGADAVTGVINIITKKSETSQIQLRQSVGRFDTQEYDMLATYKTKKWEIVLNGNFYKSEEAKLPDFYPNEFVWYNQRYSQTGEMPVGADTSLTTILPIQPYTLFRQSHWLNFLIANNRWEIGGQWNSQKHSYATSSQDIVTLAGKNYFFKENTINTFARHNWLSKNNRIAMQTLINLQAHETVPTSSFPDPYNNFKKVYSYGFNYTAQFNEVFAYHIDSSSQLQVGLNVNYTYSLPSVGNPYVNALTRTNIKEQISEQEFSGSRALWEDSTERALTRRLFLATQTNVGAFVQYKKTLFKQLFLTAGVRLDMIAQKGNTTVIKYPFTPRLGLVYKPNNNITAKLFYGEAFLAPALDLSFSNYTIVTPVVDSNNLATGYTIPYVGLGGNLAPERMRSLEANVAYNKNNFYVAVNTYYNQLTNAIIFVPDYETTELFGGIPVEYAEKSTNAGTLTSYGGFVQTEYNLQGGENNKFGLKLHADYSFSDGQINKTVDGVKTQLSLPYSAQHTFRAGFTLRYQSLSLNLRGLYRGHGHNAGLADAITGETIQIATPDFFVLNLFANYRINAKKDNWYADLFLRINNLTDTRYYHTGLNYVDIMPLTPQTPLRWSVGALFYIAP